MFMRDQIGSVTALSLAANPVALPVLAAVAGIGITVAASVFAYHEYKEYEEKKHREEIENINRLHKKYLARISVPDYNEIQGFPAIFVLPENKDTSKTQSMHLTDEQIQAIGNTLPRGTDIVLCSYRQQVLSAILKLKEYYFSRSTKKDITAGVLCYLLYMLETKCLTFEGYAYDIAYLNALTNFINAFASVSNREKTQHFSRLQPVYSYLLSAKQTLEKHKEALSLEEIIGELRDSSESYNNQLLRCFVKLVTKNKYWDLSQTAAMDELSQGVLRKKYIHSEIKSVVIRTDDELRLSNSIFKYWVMGLTDYFLKTLNPDNALTSKDVLSPEVLFAVPDITKLPRYSKDKTRKTRQQSIEIEIIENELKGIQNVFEKSQNFITTRLEQKNRTDPPKFVPVTEPSELVARTQVLADFASLIHEFISLQYLSIQLLKSIKQLGEIYVKNPKHFCNIFCVLEGLCDQVKDRIEKTQNAFVSIQQANKNAMQLEIQEVFPGQVKDILVSAYTMVTRLGASVKEYRSKVAKNINHNEPTIESVKHEMFEAAQLLSNIYHIQAKIDKKPNPKGKIDKPVPDAHPAPVPAPAPAPETASKPASVPPAKPESLPAATSAPVPPSKPVSLLSAKPASFPAAEAAEMPMIIHDESAAAEEIMSSLENKDPTRIFEKVSAILDDINKRILDIQDNEKPADMNAVNAAAFKDEIGAYMNLYNNLTEIVRKSHALINEENKSQSRNIKAKLMLELTLDMCMQAQDFMQLGTENRVHNAKKLAQDIHEQLISPQNNFIDQHDNKISYAAYSIFKSSMFATDSRKKFNRVDQASENVSHVLNK